jgi:hypothetical protein
MSEPIIKLHYVYKLNQNPTRKICHHLKYMYHVCSLQSALASETNKQSPNTKKDAVFVFCFCRVVDLVVWVRCECGVRGDEGGRLVCVVCT